MTYLVLLVTSLRKPLQIFLCAVLFILKALPSAALEESIIELLEYSPLAQEAGLRYRLEVFSADEYHTGLWPVLYLAAPTAYSVSLPPEGRHAAQARLGVRGRHPFGVQTDIFWEHNLEYQASMVDLYGEEQTGFIQHISAQAGVSIPMYHTGYACISTVQASRDAELAALRYQLELTILVQSFVEDWFENYRSHVEYTLQKQRVEVSRAVAEARRSRAERGDIALHELWDTERALTSDEMQLFQTKRALQNKYDMYELTYGTEYPETPQIPESTIAWKELGIAPQVGIEQRLQNVRAEEHELSYAAERESAAPEFVVSFALEGPVSEVPKNLTKSLARNFESFDNWSPSMSLGFSLSSNDLRSAARVKQRTGIKMDLERLKTKQERSEHINTRKTLYRALEQYRRVYDRDSSSLQDMRNYLEDMRTRQAEGLIDQLQLREIELKFTEMLASLNITRSYIRETELVLELLGE